MNSQTRQYLAKHSIRALSPKAVLFDMDGVLYDSMPMHAVAWQQSMAQFGLTMTAADAYATEGARGIDTIRTMVRTQQQRDITLDEAQRMYDVKTKIFHSFDHPAPIIDGIPQLMELLRKQGLIIGVVTGSGQKPLINRLIRDFGRYISEDHIVTAYNVKRGKPAPDPYLAGMQKAGSLPQETIVVENAPLGVRAAVAADAFTIAVNTGPLDPQLLADQGCQMVFDSMTDLATQWPDLWTELTTAMD